MSYMYFFFTMDPIIVSRLIDWLIDSDLETEYVEDAFRVVWPSVEHVV